jgi:hypothetical protein
MNWAPAAMQARAVCGSRTVPAPITTRLPACSCNCCSSVSAFGTLIVTSITSMPAASTPDCALCQLGRRSAYYGNETVASILWVISVRVIV